jgi:RimJ/RimL family protein N-acetyltransferase
MSELWNTPVTLTGKYVRLEPMTEAHVPGLAAVGLDDRIWAYMLYGKVQTEADMRFWVLDILNRQAQGTDLAFVAVHLASGRLAGATRYLNMSPPNRNLEIGGTWYGLEFQRTVVNTECKYLLLKYAFEILKCIRVQFKADACNVPSLHAIERIGAKWEGVLRNHLILPDGRYRDSVFYSIIDSEWTDVKARLEVPLGGF